MKDDSELFNTKLNLNNQKVIHKDCDRTRALERKVHLVLLNMQNILLLIIAKNTILNINKV